MVTTMAVASSWTAVQGHGRWRATLLHGGVIAALCAGLLALWTAVALMAALLTHPGSTMFALQQDGARGVPTVVRQGTAVVVSEVRGIVGRSAR